MNWTDLRVGWLAALLALGVCTCALAQQGGMFPGKGPPGGGAGKGPMPGSRAPFSGARIEWIDVHAHPVSGRGISEDTGSAVAAGISVMETAAIRRMILMPPPASEPGMIDLEQLAPAVRRHGARAAFLAGGGSLNVMIHEHREATTVEETLRRKFVDRAEAIVAAGARGFGEMAAHHVSMMPGHPYESVRADHPLFLLLADIAAEKNVVIDLHLDAVTTEMPLPQWFSSPPNPQTLAPTVPALERLLSHNRKARIVWAHAGSDVTGHWDVALSRRMLSAHANLYMSLRLMPGRVPANFPLQMSGEIKPEWMELLQEFPDRFVIGADQFFATGAARAGPGGSFAMLSERARDNTARFLAALPKPLAQRIAVDNAVRLYRLDD